LTDGKESEQTSFVSPEEQGQQEANKMSEEKQKEIREQVKKQTPPTGQNPLALLEKFDKLIELKEKELGLIEKNTAAMNALTSTLVAQVRKDIPEPQKQSQVSQEATKLIQNPPTLQHKDTPLPIAKQKSSGVIEDAKGCFTDNLVSLLNFTEEETYIRIAPIKYLGSDNFAKIASTIRELGGEYISAGKESHFRLPKGNIPK